VHHPSIRYRVAVTAKTGVPGYPPMLASPNIFEQNTELREWILCKVLNGNRATFKAKTFVQKVKRTKKDLLTRLHQDLMGIASVCCLCVVMISKVRYIVLCLCTLQMI